MLFRSVRGAANLRKAIHPAPAKAESVLTSVMTDFYDVSLVLATVFLLVMLGWSVSLRRRVREQTLQIRDQVKREAALEDLYRSLFKNANDVIYTLDLAGKILTLNRAGERALAITRDQAVRLNLRSFVVARQHADFDRWMALNAAGENAGPVEFELCVQPREGHPTILEISARRIERDRSAPPPVTVGERLAVLKTERAGLHARAEGEGRLLLIGPLRVAGLLLDALVVRSEEPEQSLERIAAPRRQAFVEADLLNADRKSTRLNSSHVKRSRMPSSA